MSEEVKKLLFTALVLIVVSFTVGFTFGYYGTQGKGRVIYVEVPVEVDSTLKPTWEVRK
jgi:hypothetical protein